MAFYCERAQWNTVLPGSLLFNTAVRMEVGDYTGWCRSPSYLMINMLPLASNGFRATLNKVESRLLSIFNVIHIRGCCVLHKNIICK